MTPLCLTATPPTDPGHGEPPSPMGQGDRCG